MSENSLARRYARALVACLAGEEQYRRVRDDLDRFNQVLDGDEQLRTGMQTFLFSTAQKQTALAAAGAALAMDPLTQRFLGTLLEENRLALLPHLGGEVDRLWRERQGQETVVVWSVLPLEPRQRDELARSLERSFKLRVVLENRIDPGLVAGIRVERGSTVYDFSLQGNLQKLREAIAGD